MILPVDSGADLDAEEGVGHGTGPGGVRADEVALHHVVAGVEDENPVLVLPGPLFPEMTLRSHAPVPPTELPPEN